MSGLVGGDNLMGIGGRDDVVEHLRLAWELIKGPVVMPLLRVAVFVCAVMSVMLFVERVYMAAVIVCVKLLGKKRYTKYRREIMREDLERSRSHPRVLVQIPMYNEKEQY
ncbi:glucomannan 4-beta-mannosyltransferase 1-like isoform X2 [Magnolia sinica]|uniref:glucomannan 4-beta-mannosyltransferase 1-like isoform X2 n=1 Tax=Magnolia sinica TaxID=86752 RepID=UPI00265A3922|nr:glucomannan 4-beta-mannosyltransferase 1-like isoform X2 [Magnolia sinica]